MGRETTAEPDALRDGQDRTRGNAVRGRPYVDRRALTALLRRGSALRILRDRRTRRNGPDGSPRHALPATGQTLADAGLRHVDRAGNPRPPVALSLYRMRIPPSGRRSGPYGADRVALPAAGAHASASRGLSLGHLGQFAGPRRMERRENTVPETDRRVRMGHGTVGSRLQGRHGIQIRAGRYGKTRPHPLGNGRKQVSAPAGTRPRASKPRRGAGPVS